MIWKGKDEAKEKGGSSRSHAVGRPIMGEICVNRKLSGGPTQPPQRQNTILGHRVVARLSDQPHISGCGGQVEEWGEWGRSSIEGGDVWIGDVR